MRHRPQPRGRSSPLLLPARCSAPVRERLTGSLLPSASDYSRSYGITRQRLARFCPSALVMHPGPINRGVELEGALADGPHSLILDQVEAGVAVRAAILEAAAG